MLRLLCIEEIEARALCSGQCDGRRPFVCRPHNSRDELLAGLCLSSESIVGQLGECFGIIFIPYRMVYIKTIQYLSESEHFWLC